MTPTSGPLDGTSVGPSDGAGQSDAFAELLRGAFRPTLAAGVLAIIVAAFSDVTAAWSAALGAVLVLGFFTASLLVMKRTAHLPPTTVMAVVMITYTVKVVVLGVVMFVVRGATWLNGYAAGVTITVCALVWLFFEMRAYKRLRIFAFSPGEKAGA
ncbi:MAG: hypothetical protein IPJ15_00460 [Actinomycetales bacterium]|jgi:ATP synthase protein I|nr:hypothetical protein [Candidatus Phosphoribacter baldrii]